MTQLAFRVRQPRLKRLALLLSALATVMFAAASARADVTAEGDVTPNTDPALPLMGGTVATQLIVGGAGTVGIPPVGRLVIDDPGFTLPLIGPSAVIGNNSNGLGEVTMSGFGSEWQIQNLLSVGLSGVGYLNVSSGSRLWTNTSAQTNFLDSDVGQNYGSQGFVTLTGFGTQWLNSNFYIGDKGFGQVEVYDRAQIITGDEAILGRQYSLSTNEIGTGYVIVDGKGTRWDVGDVHKNVAELSTGNLTVGNEARGTVEIRNQGLVNVENDTLIGDKVNSFGQVYITGVATSGAALPSTLWNLQKIFVGSATTTAPGELYLSTKGTARADQAVNISAHGLVQMAAGGVILTPTITNAGIIRGDGRLDGAVINNGQIRNAALLANLREKLWVTGPVTNNSDFESIGGEMEFLSTFNNNGPDADFVAKDAIIRFDGALTNTGNFFIDNSVVWSPGTFTSNAALVVAANTSTMIGSLSLGDSNSLLVELGNQFSRLEVSSTAALGGTLRISLGDDYVPHAGDAFEILEATSRTGTFANVIAPSISGITFAVTYQPDSVIVKLNAGFVFNSDWSHNGTVGAEDLAIWQMNFGNMVPAGTLGDANGDGQVDGADFNIWQQQNGTMPVVAAAGSVPEPSSVVMMLAALAYPLRRRSRRTK